MKKKIIALIIVFSLFVGAVPKPASAAIPVVDIKALATEILRGVLTSALSRANERFIQRFVNRAMDQYRVRDYLQYTSALRDTVYVSSQLEDKDQKTQFLVKSILNNAKLEDQSLGTDLTPVYRQMAQQNYNIENVKNIEPGPASFNYLAQAGNFYNNPVGQKFKYETKAGEIQQKANEAAKQDIASSQGYKTSYDCKPRTGENSTVATIGCISKSPGSYIESNVTTKLQGLINKKVVPPNTTKAIILELGNTVANILSNQLFGGPATAGLIIPEKPKTLAPDINPPPFYDFDGD